MDRDAIAALLGEQCGVIARRQLSALGCRPHDLERMIRRRELTRVYPGVFVDHTGPLQGDQRCWAAVLALWPAALYGESALAPDRPGTIHIALARGRRFAAPPGVRVHLLRGFGERVLWNRSPPRQRLEDAVLDVAASSTSAVAALEVIADACRTRRTTPRRLLDALTGRPQLHRRAWLRSVLTDVEAGTASVLEHAYLTRVERAHGLPRATRQVRAVTRSGLVYRDVEYEFGLLVELDGRLAHDTAAGRDADFERDLDAAVDGRATVRLSWGQVVDRPCDTTAKLARLLRGRGWTGAPRACSARCPVLGRTR